MEHSVPTRLAMSWISMKKFILSSWKVDLRLILVYVVVYFVAGFVMNEFGKWAEIARFKHWWQIITTYVIYMIPISLLLRKLPWHMQYAYGLIAMGLLEFVGYTFQSSIAYPNNILDQLFNIRNFSLGMALFFALYFPVGNALVSWLAQLIFGPQVINGSSGKSNVAGITAD